MRFQGFCKKLTSRWVKKINQTKYFSGIQNFQATEEDVDIWMKMADPKNTGRVSLEGYESLVLKSLEKSGIKI